MATFEKHNVKTTMENLIITGGYFITNSSHGAPAAVVMAPGITIEQEATAGVYKVTVDDDEGKKIINITGELGVGVANPESVGSTNTLYKIASQYIRNTDLDKQEYYLVIAKMSDGTVEHVAGATVTVNVWYQVKG